MPAFAALKLTFTSTTQRGLISGPSDRRNAMGRASGCSGCDRVKNLDEILARQPANTVAPRCAQGDDPRVVSNQQIENISASIAVAICRRHEIRSESRVVRPFPHRNGILATFPFGIDIRHDDRATEGLPVFP